MEFPKELKYSQDHEWLRVEGNNAVVGITEFAQRELGDIVFVDVDTDEEDLEKEEVFGSIEAVKTVSDLFMPINGRILDKPSESIARSKNLDTSNEGKVELRKPSDQNILDEASTKTRKLKKISIHEIADKINQTKRRTNKSSSETNKLQIKQPLPRFAKGNVKKKIKKKEKTIDKEAPILNKSIKVPEFTTTDELAPVKLEPRSTHHI